MNLELVTQRTGLVIDLQMRDRNIKRKTQRIEELEKQIINLKEDFKQMRFQCEELKEIIKFKVPDADVLLLQPMFAPANPTYTHQVRVVKPLRGGIVLYTFIRSEKSKRYNS
jgi:hypothetical protein